MCLLPFGGFNTYLIPPSEKGSKLADYLKVVILMHFLLAICLFLSLRWVDGVFDLIGILIGYMAIRNPAHFNLQQVLCYSIFCGLDFFWGIIKMIMFFSGVSTTDAPSAAWSFYIYVGTLIGAPVIYFLGSYIAYQLYKELKLTLENTAMQASAMGGDPYGSSSFGAPQQGPQTASDYNSSFYGGASGSNSTQGTTSGGSLSYNARPPTTTRGATGFKPFTGEGHTLGS